jgi:hypothetical protein
VRALAVAIAALVAATMAAAVAMAATCDQRRVAFTKLDQAAARRIAIHRSDLLGSAWRGGALRPTSATINGDSCPAMSPKQSDLVVTGVAETRYRAYGVDLFSVVEILRSRWMVVADWRRSVFNPRLAACERYAIAKGLGHGARVMSFRRIRFPEFTKFSREYRAVVSIPTAGRRVKLIVDSVIVGQRRVEFSINAFAPVAAASDVTRIEKAAVERALPRMKS